MKPIARYILQCAEDAVVDYAATQVRSSADVVQFLEKVWPPDMRIKERMLIVFLDRGNNICGYANHSEGGVAGTVVDPKLVFALALQIAGCNSIILAHNHPSGNLLPSAADNMIAKKVKNAGEALELKLLDFLILTPDNGYTSYADEGTL